MDLGFLFSLFIFTLLYITIYYRKYSWKTTHYNTLKMWHKLVLKSVEVEEQVRQVWKRCLEKPNIWNSSWITVCEIYICIYIKKISTHNLGHEHIFTNWQIYCYLYTCTVVWWRYTDPVSLSLQTTTMPATGRPWGSVWQWAAYARTLGWSHEKNTVC